MIDKTLFQEELAELGQHYGAEITKRILKIYYKHLNEHLNQEEFVEAIELAVIKIPCRFRLPSPEELVELIQGDKEVKAITEWRSVVNAAARGSHEKLAYLSSRALVALDGIGGLDMVSNYEGSLDKLEKQFIQIYCQCSTKDAKTLKPAPQPKRITNYNVCPGDPVTPEQWRELKTEILGRQSKYKNSQFGKNENNLD